MEAEFGDEFGAEVADDLGAFGEDGDFDVAGVDDGGLDGGDDLDEFLPGVRFADEAHAAGGFDDVAAGGEFLGDVAIHADCLDGFRDFGGTQGAAVTADVDEGFGLVDGGAVDVVDEACEGAEADHGGHEACVADVLEGLGSEGDQVEALFGNGSHCEVLILRRGLFDQLGLDLFWGAKDEFEEGVVGLDQAEQEIEEHAYNGNEDDEEKPGPLGGE